MSPPYRKVEAVVSFGWGVFLLRYHQEILRAKRAFETELS